MTSLIDSFGREITYIRVSVTDKCDLRCDYCSPAKGVHPNGKYTEYLTAEEISRICSAFVRLGVKRIRFTGGEPLLRKDLTEIVSMINQDNDNLDLSLSTNATRLERYAKPLYQAGIRRLNISLDTLNADEFNRITRGGNLNKVLTGIYQAKKIGFDPIKINTVMMRGVNDDQMENLIDWSAKYGLELRFIEIMPIGKSGIDSMNKHIPMQEMLERVEKHLGEKLIPSISRQGGGPAKYYRTEKKHLGIGVISAVSQHFCATCNRVRLTSRGTLALCLGQEHSIDLRQPIRDGISDNELEAMIVKSMELKPERHFFNENRKNIEFRQMVSLGG
jgi:cyclic pyranopterin phosphate synthase